MKCRAYVSLFFEILFVVVAIVEIIVIGSGLVRSLYGI